MPTASQLRLSALGFMGCLLFANASLRADPVISEFMAANRNTLPDEDGAYSDWIELFNPDQAAADLNGWYLTDSATNKTKWQFPAVTLPPGGYLVLFASDKNRRDPAGRLHTNFELDADGEYLALVKPDGTSVASEFAPKFPKQQNNTSYGYPTGASAGSRVFLQTATPGAANSGPSGTGLTDTVAFSRSAGPFQAPFSLTLTGAGSGTQIRYVLAPVTAAARDTRPTATSPLYEGPIAISSSIIVRAAIFTSDGAARGPIRSVYYSQVSPALATFASTLPVLVIDSLGSGPLVKDGIDRASWIHVYPPRANQAPVFSAGPELASPASIKVRGASSAEFDKKGYNFSFDDEFGKAAAPPLLDLGAHGKWALVGPWKYDPSYIKNPLVYELSRRMGRWAARTRVVEVYFNADGGEVDPDDYAGIYILTDRIEVDKKRVDLAVLTPDEITGADLTGGYILKVDSPDPDEIGWLTSRGYPRMDEPSENSSIVLVAPAANDIARAQLDYIRDYVQRMENALFASRDSGWSQRPYLDYLDRAAWVDHHLLNTLTANPDAFVRSAYFSKDKNSRLVAGPVWDFDRALGCDDDQRSYRWDVWSGQGAAEVWKTGWWGVLAHDPEFMQDWVDRWQSLRASEFSNGKLIELVTALGASVGAAAAARDTERWIDNISVTGSHAGQINDLKEWITLRAGWIDEQFVEPPDIRTASGNITFTPPAGAQLAYTLDGSDPRSLGGAIAPNATVTSSPLSVPASANVHVRSYDASRRDLFPGSPWSSAVGGASSTPLAPVARLVNLSSRAVVGRDENALIVGVVVADTESKRYLSRAIGPALAVFGATDFVPDPQLVIFNDRRVELFRNQGWPTGPNASALPGYARSVGAFALPADSLDSALASSLTAGAYTLQVTTPTARNGVGLAELYELDANGRTTNLSTRAQVQAGDGVLIGGFVVQGPAYKRILIRGIGPTLSAFGVAGALRDPVLTVYSGQEIVATNDRWGAAPNLSTVVNASRIVGAFDLVANSEDAAIFLTVPPGAFTVKVSGKDNSVGVALLEIYEVP